MDMPHVHAPSGKHIKVAAIVTPWHEYAFGVTGPHKGTMTTIFKKLLNKQSSCRWFKWQHDAHVTSLQWHLTLDWVQKDEILRSSNILQSFYYMMRCQCSNFNNGCSVNMSYCQIYVNSSPLDKMAAILAGDIFKCIFLNENDRIPFQISLKLVPGNGFASKRRQALTCTNDDPIHRCIDVALGGDELLWRPVFDNERSRHMTPISFLLAENNTPGFSYGFAGLERKTCSDGIPL